LYNMLVIRLLELGHIILIFLYELLHVPVIIIDCPMELAVDFM
jgi:hypothetical protein